MSIFTKLRDWFLSPLLDQVERERLERIERVRNYRQGDQRQALKVKPGQPDHNVILNLVGTIVDRTVSMLFGAGVEFDLPGEGETPEQEYIDEVWSLNRKEILLHKVAVVGAETGTCAIQIVPDGWYSSKLGRRVPRLIPIDTALLTIYTMPDDVDIHTSYVLEYVIQENGKDVAVQHTFLRSIAPDRVDERTGATVEGETTWTITHWRREKSQWELVGSESWPYPFPPLVVWQNLPAVGQPEGAPDITPDIIRLQDKVNFIASNIQKIITLHAHPRTIGKNITGGVQVGNAGPDQFWQISGTDADIKNLEMQSDLASSMRYLEILRQATMDITHTVDISSMVDKIGALTNFGLRVLYQDALQKFSVKRELYGDALTEINRSLLVLGGFGDDPDPGEVVWGNPLPENEAEEVAALKGDLAMGIVSRQTVSERRGYVWEVEQERIEAEKASESNIGEMLLAGFERGA